MNLVPPMNKTTTEFWIMLQVGTEKNTKEFTVYFFYFFVIDRDFGCVITLCRSNKHYFYDQNQITLRP